jgi:hypothetical protein
MSRYTEVPEWMYLALTMSAGFSPLPHIPFPLPHRADHQSASFLCSFAVVLGCIALSVYPTHSSVSSSKFRLGAVVPYSCALTPSLPLPYSSILRNLPLHHPCHPHRNQCVPLIVFQPVSVGFSMFSALEQRVNAGPLRPSSSPPVTSITGVQVSVLAFSSVTESCLSLHDDAELVSFLLSCSFFLLLSPFSQITLNVFAEFIGEYRSLGRLQAREEEEERERRLT